MKLYPEEESNALSTKKPVVVESYDEIVISEPSEAFFARVQHHPAVIVPRLPAGFTLPPGKVCLYQCFLKVFFITVFDGAICFLYFWLHPTVLQDAIFSICVLTVPMEDLENRNRGDTKDHPLNQWFSKFSEADELLRLAAAREQVNMSI